VGIGLGDDVAVGVGVAVGEGVDVGFAGGSTAYMLMAPVLSVPQIIPNGLEKPFAYEPAALWSRWPVPATSIRLIWTLLIIASPYVVPEATVYGVGSLMSTQEKDVLILTGLACSNKVLADPPLVAYNAAIAFPDVVPSMYAMISVTGPVIVLLKNDTD